MKKQIILSLSVIAVLVIIFFSIKINIENKNIKLKEQIKAENNVCKANFDKMFKTIQNVASVSNEYKKTFEKVYPEIMQGRYGKDGNNLMKWIQESNPKFETKLYEDLIAAIESNRKEFFNHQEKLIDVNREHRTFIQKFPNSLFINADDTVAITIITSTKTEEVYKTGKDDDYNIKFN